MTLFDHLVNTALSGSSGYEILRPVVEKEILHHDILRILSKEGFLKNLVFMGGTCLRNCYGSPRLSEDLDFTSDLEFKASGLKSLSGILQGRFLEKYGLKVEVKEPQREVGDTKTWKIKIITRPEQSHLPAQKIHIDICSIPSLNRTPAFLRNHYNIDLGTSGMIIQIESREEILADKFAALALRSNRIKNRDIWDIIWLKQQTVELNPEWVVQKAEARGIKRDAFRNQLLNRIEEMKNQHDNFMFEIKRFLPSKTVEETLSQSDWWQIAQNIIGEEAGKI
jgi:predicted nucleotidyltransferase component of viral defense system